MMVIDEVEACLRSYRYSFSNEVELQDGVEEALSAAGFNFERESAVPPTCDRIDFRVGFVGIEVKVGGSLFALVRQLHRYASAPSFNSFIVVTSLVRLSNLPREISGKPLRVVRLTEAML